MLRSLVLPMYLPALLLAAGSGAMSTFLPLYLTQLGASVGTAALLVGLGSAGILIFDLPSGFVVARYGERRVLVISGLGMVIAPVVVALSPGPALVTVGVFLANATASFWLLGRLEFMRKALSPEVRGRGLATVGGIMRVGLFLGPLAGGVAARALGYRVVFLATGVLAALSLLLFLMAPRPAEPPRVTHTAPPPLWDTRALVSVIRARGSVLATAGVSMLILSMVRSGRSLLLPLWGQEIGLDTAGIGLVVGLSSAVDTLMFYPAGMISDARGRKWSAVLCLLILSVGLGLIPLTHSLGPFLAVALLIGVGNGLGSGINMTLGADFAAGVEPGLFLGVWRLVTDLGSAAAPVMIGLVAAVVALAPSAVVIAGVGVAGGVFHGLLVKETFRRRGR